MEIARMAKRIVIIGAGFCGLSCAAELSRCGDFDITILEQSTNVGGLGGGIRTEQGAFDFGSHRLHTSMHKTARHLLDELPVDLDKKVRRGKLRLSGAYTKYPPSLLNLAWCMGAAKMSQACISLFMQRTRSGDNVRQTYESTMRRKVGDTFYETFFGPYACKLWGMDPACISLTAAGRWSGNESPGHGMNALWSSNPLLHKNEYLYPRTGFRHLAEALAGIATSRGVRIKTSCAVKTIQSVQGLSFQCDIRDKGREQSIAGDWIVNTAPIDEQVNMVRPGIDKAGELSRAITWRGLRLVYIVTNRPVDSTGPESLYFPELAYPFGRISFPSRYSPEMGSLRGESLCIEMICSPGDRVWNADEQELLSIILPPALQAGVCSQSGIAGIFSVRFPHVYPVYSVGWENPINAAIKALTYFDNYLPAGKMGLFLHCNIDHAMNNGILAARHIADGAGPADWRSGVSAFQKVSVRN
jgi:protoporphyrinogen oxidase